MQKQYILNNEAFSDESMLNELSFQALCDVKSRSESVYCKWLSHAENSVMELSKHHDSENVQYRVAVASNISCPDYLLSALSKDNNAHVTMAVSANPSTSTRTLNEMTANKLTHCFTNICKHPNVSHEAVQFIATTTSDVERLKTIARRVNNTFKIVSILIAKAIDEVTVEVAKHSPLNDTQVAMMWAKRPELKRALLTNPNLSEDILPQLIKVASKKEVQAILTHNNIPKNVLSEIARSNDIELKYQVASHPSLPISDIQRLSTETRGNVNSAVVKNPSAPEDVLKALSYNNSIHIKQAVASHPNTASETLDRLALDESPLVRKSVAQHPNTPLDKLKKLASDKEASVSRYVLENQAMGEVVKLDKYQMVLKNSGFGAFDFYQLHSPKKITSLFINSKHPNEVEYIFGSQDCETLNAISALQSAFTNHKGKINRADYLTFLEDVNTHVPVSRRAGLAVDNITLKTVFAFFDKELVIEILRQYAKSEAMDCLRMLATLVSFENKDLNQKNAHGVENWFERRTTGCFHDYLVAKERSFMESSDCVFFQNRFKTNITEANKLLDTGWVVNLPTNAEELLHIGSEQRHCVGTRFYAERCMDGSNIIFQIAPKDSKKHGFTFQFSRNGKLLQAKGFCNSDVPAYLTAVSKKVFSTLTDNHQSLSMVA